MASVLVTDGEQRAYLAVVRSLGRAGHVVHVGAARLRSLAGVSRFASSRHVLPDPLREPGDFARSVQSLVHARNVDLVIPVTEPSLLSLLPIRDQLGRARIPFPDLERFLAITDKQKVLEVASELGIGVPGQHVLRVPEERASLDVGALRFPLVLKPGRSVGEADGTRHKLDVVHVATPAALETALEALPAAAYPVLLQQRIVGPGIGVFLLIWDGQVRAEFSHRRIRENPPSGGVSVYRESIPADPDLVARSRTLLEHFAWQGVAMVEYKVDSTSGVAYLMEINGRFWGSLQLAVDAGVDFPRLLVDAALGAKPGPLPRYRAGVRSRWWWGDVNHVLARLRRSRQRLSLPLDAPGRLSALRDFLILWRPGDRNEVFRLGDPAPLLLETKNWFWRR
jgi:predicted ATP-grasp superfamily ATP-dependent carboligase